MAEKEAVTKKGISADWFMRGALARIGETVDKFTGRNWQPSSSVAASELIERLKKLLDAEKRDVEGKGTVVPHNIKLKMEWDKFSADEKGLRKLETELLTAAADHINDNLYYTYAPLHIEIKPDYFIKGVKLLASFEKFADEEEHEAELNVTMPALRIPIAAAEEVAPSTEPARASEVIARYRLAGKSFEKTLTFPPDGRMTVGRTGTSGFVLDDNSVSKVHASLVVSADGIAVADTGSTNGTFVNGERIAYGKVVPFTDKDSVTFGSIDVTFGRIIPPEPEPVAEVPVSENSVSIGDFEFRSREPEPDPASPPVEESLSKLETIVDDDAADEDTLPDKPAVKTISLKPEPLADDSDSAEEKPE